MPETRAADISLTEQLRGVAREIALRRRVYPGLVERGRLKEAEAQRQILVMEAVHLTLLKLISAQQADADTALPSSDEKPAA